MDGRLLGGALLLYGPLLLAADLGHALPAAPLLLGLVASVRLSGSLANLIALRLLGEGAAWWRFHLWSVPFLGVAAAAGWMLLR